MEVENITDTLNMLDFFTSDTKVDLSNCLKVLRLSEEHSKLKKIAMALIHDKFWTLYKSVDFLRLPVSIVIDILKSDDLIMTSEEDVFNVIKLWVNFNYEERQHDLVDLLKCLRFSAMTVEYIIYDIHPYCTSSPECIAIINDAIELNIIKSEKRDRPRKKSSKLIVIGSHTNQTVGIGTMESYDEEQKAWIQSRDFGFNRNKFASVLLDDRIFIIGGAENFTNGLTIVEYIDLKDGQKYTLQPLNQARYEHAGVALEQNSSIDLYAIGGRSTSTELLSSVERWNSSGQKWETNVAPMLMPVMYHSAVAISGKIYVTGGVTIRNNEKVILDDVQVYTPETDTWSHCAPMLRKRSLHTSLTKYGKMYVIGGRGEDGEYLWSIDSYDFDLDLWTVFFTYPGPQVSCRLHVFEDKCFIIGGNFCHSPLPNAVVYKYMEQTKDYLPNLNTTRDLPHIFHIPYSAII